jgi:hypothetical protein
MKDVIYNCNTSEAPRKSKAHDYTFYLDKIKALEMSREFSKLEAFCTDGDIRPPYPYQWRAISTMIPGDDDPFEGLGASPLEALRNLYKEMKSFRDNPPEDDEEMGLFTPVASPNSTKK